MVIVMPRFCPRMRPISNGIALMLRCPKQFLTSKWVKVKLVKLANILERSPVFAPRIRVDQLLVQHNDFMFHRHSRLIPVVAKRRCSEWTFVHLAGYFSG